MSQEQILTEESLSTFLCETDFILNNRPLSPVYDDPEEVDVLTPNHLLLREVSDGLVDESVNLRDRYTRRWKQGQMLVNAFWRRWLREHVPLLQLRHKWVRASRDFQPGDFVLFDMDATAFGKWNKAVIREVIRGSDNHVRQVMLGTNKGDIIRDIHRICLLGGVER